MFEFRPTISPRIYVLAHMSSNELIASVAFDPEMPADRRETWRLYVLQKLNAPQTREIDEFPWSMGEDL